MSTIAEIAHAIERLPEPEIARLALWLAEYRRRPRSASAGPHHDLDFLIGTWREDPAFDTAIKAFEQVDEKVWK